MGDIGRGPPSAVYFLEIFIELIDFRQLHVELLNFSRVPVDIMVGVRLLK